MLVQNMVLVFGLIVTVVNLLVDLSYGWFDPRIRYD
jgi:ABC-type dipeptide/oligopeptide/nickel transport system permease component